MSSLLQSDTWAKFQSLNGHRAFALRSEGFSFSDFLDLIPGVGNFIRIPRGPVFTASIREHTESLKKKLTDLASRERAVWIRVEPENETALEILDVLFHGNVIRAPHDIEPREIFVVSLEGSREDWLARMKSKTRYNVRLAEKHGVSVRFSRSTEDMSAFIGLIRETTDRKGITGHPDSYYRNFMTAFGEEGCILSLAEHEGDLLAAGLTVFFEGTAYYLHGGSSDRKRDLMAPFLLHLATMEEARRRNCNWYDFGGVRLQSKRDLQDSDWDGITRFKLGFAPEVQTIPFPGTFDIIFDRPRYALYRCLSLLSALRKAIRKFLLTL